MNPEARLFARLGSQEKDGNNCFITINRDEKRNALSGEVYYGIRDAVLAIATDPAVRAVIVRGAGKGFSSGIDFNFLASMGIVGGAQDFHGVPPSHGARRR